MDRSLYTRPNKPKTIPVKKRPRDFAVGTIEPPTLLTVHASTECHVTPPRIGGDMVDYLDLYDGLTLLEPQCGTGNLLAAANDGSYKIKITGIEKNVELYRACSRRFSDSEIILKNECFLEYAANSNLKFDRILTNPPFKQVRAHIAASLSVLAPQGVMVALVPITYNHPDAEELETLARGDFECSQVLTKLIRFSK